MVREMVDLLWLLAWHGSALTLALVWVRLKAWFVTERPALEYYSGHNLGVWTGLGVRKLGSVW